MILVVPVEVTEGGMFDVVDYFMKTLQVTSSWQCLLFFESKEKVSRDELKFSSVFSTLDETSVADTCDAQQTRVA